MPMHSFDTQDAADYGLEEAVVLHNIGFWCVKNLANRKHIHEGKVWTYNSIPAFLELLPYLCPENLDVRNADYPSEADKQKALEKEGNRRQRKMARILESLERKGAIVSGNFNTAKYDRTKWYAFADQSKLQKYGEISPEALKILIRQNCQMDMTDMSDQSDKFVGPIPDSKPDGKHTTTTTDAPEKISEVAPVASQPGVILCKDSDGDYTEAFKEFLPHFKIAFDQMVTRDGMIPQGYPVPKTIWLATKLEAIYNRVVLKGWEPDPYDMAALVIRDWLRFMSL